MRRGFIVAVLVVLFVGCAAFAGGQAWARYDAKREIESAVLLQSASKDAEALFIARSSLGSLQDGKPNEARVVLVRYAKLKAASLTDCSKSAQCVAWVGRFMPTSPELAQVGALKESP